MTHKAQSSNPDPSRPPRRARARSSLLAQGEPTVWLTGGALMVALAMVLGLVGHIFYEGGKTFWPAKLVEVHLHNGKVLLGRFTREEDYRPTEEDLKDLPPENREKAENEKKAHQGLVRRQLLEVGNQRLNDGVKEVWVPDFAITKIEEPKNAFLFERATWGRFYGYPVAFLIDGKEVATTPEEIWNELQKHHPDVLDRLSEKRDLDKTIKSKSSRAKESARLAAKKAELDHGPGSPEHQKALERLEQINQDLAAEEKKVNDQMFSLDAENDRFQIRMKTSDGKTTEIPLAEIVRAVRNNQVGFWGRMGIYFSRWGEFIADDPRESNTAGGVYPAIFGTVAMTLIMTVLVVPFGVLAALYLREYAKSGPIVSAVRIAINNLAGVPSIVFGVFGLGFFCYVVGTGIDDLFFPTAKAEGSPTFGTPGLFWASLTLALLTLPVVIVSTEEALAAVPSSMREGSYACGASKWQTIRRIVLPRAMPGVMTGTILAIARGAGEVAPLMLVGVVHSAPDLPIDGVFPYVHLERSFMHLGYHIYYVGFASPNSEAARPLVYTTALLLILIIAILTIMAVWLRSRLRKRFQGNEF